MINRKTFLTIILFIILIPILLDGLRRSNSVVLPRRRNSFNNEDRLSRSELGNNCRYILLLKPQYIVNKHKSKQSDVSNFDLKIFMGKDGLCNKVWRDIWKKCPFFCFQRHNYQLLKLKLLIQINELRKWHGVNPLIPNPSLNHLAQLRANLIAQHKLILSDFDRKNGELIGISYMYAASFIVNKWYEQKKDYSFSRGETKLNAKLFTQMVWKASTEIGIGLGINGEYIYIVCKIYPRGNQKGHYKENVFDIQNGIRRSNSAANLIRSSSYTDSTRLSRAGLGNSCRYVLLLKPEYCSTKHKSKFSCARDFDPRTMMGKDGFSNKIWKDTWKDCPFFCFQKYNYKLLKIKLVQQVNEFRKLHGMKPLNLNPSLNSLAEFRAKLIAQFKMILPDMNKKNGEMLAIAYAPAASLVVSKWYEERKHYSFSRGETKHDAKLFTQLIWKSSTDIGIGIVASGDYVYIVCKVFPKGNIRGLYKANVNDIPSKYSRFLYNKWFSNKAEK
uniref:SCP domain-containing protein n=1 Tax=Strongyloides stercoralis TaxID=6248 RepID=A0A0K0EEW7_STRER